MVGSNPRLHLLYVPRTLIVLVDARSDCHYGAVVPEHSTPRDKEEETKPLKETREASK